MNNKVAIVGTHSKTRSLAPYDDPSVDIWVLNESATDAPDGERWVKRCDAVFQMHDPMVFESLHNLSDPKHYEWLRQPHEFPIWMQEANPDIPASVKYPREEMKEELFCNFYQGLKQKDREVYDSSMDFAIALAVHLGYKEIQIYGVEVEADTEYLRQREGIKFWHGYALGRGITVRTYCGDAMFDRPVYGYEGTVRQDIKEYRTREKELHKQIVVKKTEMEIARDAYNRATENGNLSERLSRLFELNIELGYLEGNMDANRKYQKYIDDGAEIIDPTEFEISARNAVREFQKAEIEAHQSGGVLRAIFPAWSKTKDPVMLKQIHTIGQQHLNAGYLSGFLGGIKDENIRLGAITLSRMDAAGGRKALKMAEAEG